jgi:putative transcriptional regulator
VSKIIESLRGDLAALHEAGAISKVTMREFDAICPPPVREFSAADIKRLREGLKFSQPVFALHLHTSASTVRRSRQAGQEPLPRRR